MLRVTQNPTRNSKLTGDSMSFYATYREVGVTCPEWCPLLNNGCYAQGGNVAIHQRGSSSNNDGAVFLAALERLPRNAMVRLHVSGDVMLNGELDEAYLDALIQGANENPEMTFYGYTHAWQVIDRERFIFPANFVLNASCDTMEDVAVAQSLGWQTTTVIPHDAEEKRYGKVVVCPNQTSGMTCDECRLCFRERPLTVAFKAHGYAKKKLSTRVTLPSVA